MGKLVAICISKKKGTQKRDVGECTLVENHGLEGDAHAGSWHRQISLLSRESRRVMENKGIKLEDGDFGENLMTEGIELSGLTVGSMLRVNEGVLIRITQIGKECHDRCNIYYQVGDCIMPREGLFAEVIKGGVIRINDIIEVLDDKGGNSHHK
ncbi:MAG: MOSC domain-containing protein [Planctomycetes bacterium]|nr:MOSC domain-containing protein [Planctomycetota bacterium]